MTDVNGAIIAERQTTAAERRAFWTAALGAAIAGAVAAIAYARRDLTLSHYDARAHLVVARRLFDSLTPGWRQIGGEWLPLPHLLNAIPVAWDWNYRTGGSAVIISIVALAWGLGALATYIVRHTGSTVAALIGPALVLANPDVLYLQSTPMTEPLLFGCSLCALEAVDGWIRDPGPRRTHVAGAWLAALVLTRYEGWFIAAGLTVVALALRPRAFRAALAMLAWPAIGLAAFFIESWASTGRLVVTSGFYVPDNPSRQHLLAALHEVAAAAWRLAGPVVVIAAVVGLAAVAARARRSLAALLPLALVLAAILPAGAFDAGHPFRIRYMVAMVVACGPLIGLAWGMTLARVGRGLQLAAAIALVGGALVVRPPLDANAPMVVEAQRESPERAARRANVTAYLARAYDGQPILASMDSLGHYMQETSAIGLRLECFVHEGTGDLWIDAAAAPRRHVGWVLIEELAEGGDALARRERSDPTFLAGFTRVAEGGGAALYKRAP